MTHTLICSIYGLVIGRHNEIQDELLYLSQHAFTSASVRAEPIIHQDRIRSEQEICQVSDKDKEAQEDVMIRGLCDNQVGVIIDVKLDERYIQLRTNASTPIQVGNMNKDKHSKHCHNQRKRFSPFVLSVNGMLGREALVAISQLSRFMADKR